MKKVLIYVCFTVVSQLNAQQIKWAVNTYYPDGPSDLVTDLNSDVYMYGSFNNFDYQPYGNAGCFIKKFSAAGNLMIDKYIGPFSIKKMIHFKGHLYAVGHFQSTMTMGSHASVSEGMNDGFIAKLDLSGQALWLRSFGGKKQDLCNGITLSNDSTHLIVTGEVDSTYSIDGNAAETVKRSVFLGKFDFLGNSIEYKTYDFKPLINERNVGYEIEKRGQGYYLLADREGKDWLDTSASNEPEEGRYLLTLDEALEIVDQTYIAGPAYYYGYECANFSSGNGDAYVPMTRDHKLLERSHLLRIGPSNSVVKWEAQLDYGYFLDTHFNNGYLYYVSAEESTKCFCSGYGLIQKVDPLNSVTTILKLQEHFFNQITVAPNGNIYVYGHRSTGDVELGDFKLKKGSYLFAIGEGETGLHDKQANSESVRIYPNPSSGAINIFAGKTIDQIEISSLSGKRLRLVTPNSNQYTFSDLPAGVYFLKTKFSDQVVTKKLVITN